MALATAARFAPGAIVAGAAAYATYKLEGKQFKKDGLDLQNPAVKTVRFSTSVAAGGAASTPFVVHHLVTREIAQQNFGQSFMQSSRQAMSLMRQQPFNSLKAMQHMSPRTVVEPFIIAGGATAAIQFGKNYFNKASRPA